MSKESKDKLGDFKIEVKYLDAAIEALASGKDKDESERVHNFGNSIVNVAIKTKQKCESMNNGKS